MILSFKKDNELIGGEKKEIEIEGIEVEKKEKKYINIEKEKDGKERKIIGERFKCEENEIRLEG